MPHLVKLYKVHGWQCDTHGTHVKNLETPNDKTTIDPFEDMESHTTFIDIEFDTLSVYLLLDCTTTHIILRDNKCFSYLGPMITKHITTITSRCLVLYQIDEVCLVMPRDTCIHVSRVVYSPTSITNLLSPRFLMQWFSLVYK